MAAKTRGKNQAVRWFSDAELQAVLGARYERLAHQVRAHFQALVAQSGLEGRL